ncbi:MAG: hypothetical protein HYZ18_14735 [Pseudogulbenkiania sp.]|nr:hypothetical protein [Pseudogulbenkiania sp.]
MVVLILVSVIASLVVLWQALVAINAMCPGTRFAVRLAHCVLAAGAFGNAVAAFTGRPPGLAETVLSVGVALYMLTNRRKRVCHVSVPRHRAV